MTVGWCHLRAAPPPTHTHTVSLTRTYAHARAHTHSLHLSIQADGTDTVVLSGGTPLSDLQWSKWTPPQQQQQQQPNSCDLTITEDTACTRNPYRNMTGTAEECCSSCVADFKCGAFSHHSNSDKVKAECLFSTVRCPGCQLNGMLPRVSLPTVSTERRCSRCVRSAI
jgi:hypothetical protein